MLLLRLVSICAITGLKMRNWRIAGAAVCALCAIGVDFTNMLMSVVSDLLFVSGIFFVLWPLLRKKDGEA